MNESEKKWPPVQYEKRTGTSPDYYHCDSCGVYVQTAWISDLSAYCDECARKIAPERVFSMKDICLIEALDHIAQRASEGLHVDARVRDEIKKAERLRLLVFEREADFLSLIWHEISHSRLLTPGGSRTLRDVAERMIREHWTFELLARGEVESAVGYDPAWFQRCREINERFDSRKFQWMIVTPPNQNESCKSPSGTYYIFDGAHKSLVLAYKLLLCTIAFFPVEGLLIEPRPAC